MLDMQTSERVSQNDLSDNYVYQRSVLAYHETAKLISGSVLEIGTGSGYGIEILAPKSADYTTIDKFAHTGTMPANARFIQMTVPPLSGFGDGQFDFVVSFQVIEHIKNDEAFVKEIHRVLKKGGKFIVTTPNKVKSLTRNPWHVREYTKDEFSNLMKKHFSGVAEQGVSGDEVVEKYYEENKRGVARFKRLDFLDLEHRLPRFMLQFPYDVLNRINRKKLLKNNYSLTSGIKMENYFIKEADENCFDWFYILEK